MGEENSEGCDESFVMLDVTKNQEVTCQETIVGMYLYNDSNAVREVFKTKVENCGLIPEFDLLQIAKAHGPISSNFKRGKNEITMEEYMEELAELQKEELSEAEKVVKMIEQMDLNRDGIVGCDEFVVNLANNYL